MRHVVARARKQRDPARLRWVTAVQLAADAIELVLNMCQPKGWPNMHRRDSWLNVRLYKCSRFHRSGRFAAAGALDLRSRFGAALALLLRPYLLRTSRHRFFHRIDRAR